MSSFLPQDKDWYADYVKTEQFKGFFIKSRDGDKYHVSIPLIEQILLPFVAETYRFDPDNEIWYEYTGLIWKRSKTLYQHISDSVRDFYKRFKDDSLMGGSIKLLAHDFPAQVKKRFENNPLLHKYREDFDSDPYLLNTPNGAWNLETGKRYPNRMEDFCKLITLVEPLDDEDGTKCPKYMAHLNWLAQDDQDVVKWLEGISGYILNGKLSVNEFFWFTGISKSGKSQLTIAWREILGGYKETSYYVSIPNKLFTLKQNDPHPEIWARLIGKRFALAEEVPPEYWNQGMIKEYLSGNPINPRRMYGETYSELPTAKLVFISNKEPKVDASDSGMQTRLNLIPCTKAIPPENRIMDYGIDVLFKEEGPYILNRMIKAAHEFSLRNKKLPPTPKAIVEASQEYFVDNNDVKPFIDDACDTGNEHSCPVKTIYNAYSFWCQQNAFDPMSMTKFSPELKAHGYKPIRTNKQRLIKGLKVTDAYLDQMNKLAHHMYN